ncbi:MAG: putative metal-binding motif-containing protein [Alphaproteobacteria bacterium]|nr:putative metal-binding motif-containing protein [Alphaproteobacteria bacterium]
MLTLVAQLALATDVFVSDATELEAALVAAPTSGGPGGYVVHTAPGTYDLNRLDLSDRRFELHALVPGSVTLVRANDTHLFHLGGSADVVFAGIGFDGAGASLVELADTASLVVERARFEGGGSPNNARGGYLTLDSTGSVTVQDSTFAAATVAGDGGHVRHLRGDLTVVSSTFSGGVAGGSGGCIYSDGDVLLLDRVEVRQCTAGGTGGGLHVQDVVGTATVDTSWFEQNTAGSYGGSLASRDPLSVDHSVICRGASTGTGTGGIYWVGDADEDLDVGSTVFLNNGSNVGNFGGGSIRGDSNGGGGPREVRVLDTSFTGNTAYANPLGRFNLANSSSTVLYQRVRAAYNSTANNVVGRVGSESAMLRDSAFYSPDASDTSFSTSNNSSAAPGFDAPPSTSCDPLLIRPPSGVLGAFHASGIVDSDNDGYVAPIDCDDSQPGIHPGAGDTTCDGIDDDCDHAVDEDAPTVTLWLDRDGDGLGDPDFPVQACGPLPFLVADDTDCDDDGSGALAQWFTDADGDGFGDTAQSVMACSQPPGTVAAAGDCDDSEPAVFPGADEACNTVDDDCDGQIDEGVLLTFFADLDGDGHGDPAGPTTEACSVPPGHADVDDDCDDTTDTVFPGAPELCNGTSDDCDAQVDEGLPTTTWYVDADGDGYGDAPLVSCETSQPAGTATVAGDCQDDPTLPGSAAVHPGALELCDGLDNDCDGFTDLDDPEGAAAGDWYPDVDGDGFGATGSAPVTSCAPPAGHAANADDCDDADPHVSPAEPDDACDGVDANCDGIPDDGALPTTWWIDADGDGYGTTEVTGACPEPGQADQGGDCDDTDATVNPGRSDDDCDGEDDDCDGRPDDDAPVVPNIADDDGDGHWGEAPGTTTCPEHAVTDCDDTRADVSPDAPEQCGPDDLDCNGVVGDEQLDCGEPPDPEPTDGPSIGPPGEVGCGCASGTPAPGGPAVLLVLAVLRRRSSLPRTSAPR